MRIFKILCLLMILGPTGAKSDDLLACVDPDVVSALLAFGFRAGSEVTDEMPQRYARTKFPHSFDFIGTMASEHYINVAFRTDLVADYAESEITELLEDQGWRRMPEHEDTRPGFQSSQDQLRRRVSLCHANGDSVAVMTRNLDDRTLVMLFGSVSERAGDCNRQRASDRGIDYGYTDEIMPTLRLPNNARTQGSGRGGIIRSSGDDADTHVRILTDLQPEAVHEHFADQLTTQGWLRDVSWVGGISQGSTWSLSRDELPRTVGNLEVIKHSDGDYSAKFSMLAL